MQMCRPSPAVVAPIAHLGASSSYRSIQDDISLRITEDSKYIAMKKASAEAEALENSRKPLLLRRFAFHERHPVRCRRSDTSNFMV